MSTQGRLRLAVNTSIWNPSDEEFDFLCSLLPSAEAEDCKKFRFLEDKKRALVSRLLQRHAAFLALGIPHEAVIIERTKGRKPYIANDIPKPNAPNYNYSVSHEGDYVVLASEDICVCGCDVAAPHQLRRNANQPLSTVLEAFTKQLTPSEWAFVRNNSTDEAQIESKFRQIWSLKEAYVKATGEGLGFDLGRCEFKLQNGSSARAAVAVDGKSQPQWTFHLHELGSEHWVSVARAPVTAIVDAWGKFKASLQLPNVPQTEHQAALDATEPPFTMLCVSDLVPMAKRNEYEAAGGDLI